jgi:hypothetical protein
MRETAWKLSNYAPLARFGEICYRAAKVLE